MKGSELFLCKVAGLGTSYQIPDNSPVEPVEVLDALIQEARTLVSAPPTTPALDASAADNQRALDMFAAAALTGFLAAYSGQDVTLPSASKTGYEAYEYAEWMMIHRSQRDEKGQRLPPQCQKEGCEETGTRWCELCGDPYCAMHSIKTDETTQCDNCRGIS